MTHGTQVVIVTLFEMQLGILVVDTRNLWVGGVAYDGKARALYSLRNRQGLLPWFCGTALIYHLNKVSVRVYVEMIILWMLHEWMLSLALIVDTDGINLESHSSNTRSGIQDDVEHMEVSIVPAIFVLARRVGVLVQNIAGAEIIQSDLGTSFEKDSNSRCCRRHTSFP